MLHTKEKEIKEWFPLIVAAHMENAKMASTKGETKSPELSEKKALMGFKDRGRIQKWYPLSPQSLKSIPTCPCPSGPD